MSLESHGIAQALQAAECAFDDALLVARLKKVGPEVAVRLLVRQHVINDDEQALSHSPDGFLLAQPPGQGVVLR